ncbi:hypothetical protein AB0C29_16400 [Actinoplanes sp. NPDC048791]|uniref:hypothetical protein n=1 Tax=Actinoplanes sp. NPDC048791 TaxID=3154623 RepID=UPI0033ED9375
MTGTTRVLTRFRTPVALASLAIVLAALGSVPEPPRPADDDRALYALCRKTLHELLDKYRDADNTSFAMVCDRPDGTFVDPKLWMPAATTLPSPMRAITTGRPGCVTGPGRPVFETTLLDVRDGLAWPGNQIVYEYGPLDGSRTGAMFGSRSLEFGPGELAPGASYRWRARFDPAAEEEDWSPWCEFTVSADAVDYRGLDDVSLETLNELGLRPDRSYAVSLTRRQQRLLRAGTNVSRTNARMTLTGPRWTDLLLQLSGSAFLADEAAIDGDDADRSPPESAAYRALVDAISVELGGPRHPDFGFS